MTLRIDQKRPTFRHVQRYALIGGRPDPGTIEAECDAPAEAIRAAAGEIAP